ncbi:MAG: hypothetical protein Q9192_005190 [Flavoplaca navasiana]
MSDSASSSEELTIGWAARVSLPQLGARLMAYVETKASIITFRLAARYTSSPALRNLAEEILTIIATCVRDASYQSKIEEWIKLDRCLANACDPLSHFSHEEMTKRYRYCTNWMTGDEISYDDFSQETWDRHDELTTRWYDDLTATDGGPKISKYAKVYAHDFGIRPLFLLNKQYEPDDFAHPRSKVDAKAYLIIPLSRLPMSTTYGRNLITFAVDSSLDLSTFTGLTKQQHQNFMTAAAILKLRAYDPNEDVTIFNHLPGSCGCTRWEDCQNPHKFELPGDDKIDHTKCGCNAHVTVNGVIKRDTNSVGRVLWHGPADYHPRYDDKPEKPLERKQIQPRLRIFGSGELAAQCDCNTSYL